MNMIRELERIAKSEINFSISCFYDDGWRFQLGDELNGFTFMDSFTTIRAGVNELIRQIIKQYPNSEYIKDLHKRCDSVFHGLDLFRVGI